MVAAHTSARISVLIMYDLGLELQALLSDSVIYTFTFRAFSRHFYPKSLTISTTAEERETIYCCLYSKDVHKNECQAPIIARLTHSRTQKS